MNNKRITKQTSNKKKKKKKESPFKKTFFRDVGKPRTNNFLVLK